MTEQELNKRRARWVWGKKNIRGSCNGRFLCYIDSDGNHMAVPNFPDYINACFEWLVPKFHAWTIGSTPDGDICAVVVLKKDIRGEACAEETAIALCQALDKALDKLINSEVKP